MHLSVAKFPCKPSLALMLLGATAPEGFVAAALPEWVEDRLGRRRKGTGPSAKAGMPAAGVKNIGEALALPAEVEPDDPVAAGRREAARRKRAAETQAAIASGLAGLDQWISDQLRLGLTGFVDAASERCLRIAARLVDAKAAALASRIDELPARLMALRSEERPEAAIRALGKLVLLANAWWAGPEDPELKRLVATSETREQVLANADSIQVDSSWEVLGEQIETRRDGLVSHATWLLDLKAQVPRFALLQDYYPVSAGRRANAFSSGERFAARLAFFPTCAPLRALVADRAGEGEAGLRWPQAGPETGRAQLAEVLESPRSTALVAGCVAHLLYEAGSLDAVGAALLLERRLSPGTPIVDAAGFFEGFLSSAGHRLIHYEALRCAVDAWLKTLGETDFIAHLPLLRRVFANLNGMERRRLIEAVLGRAGRLPASFVPAPDGGVGWQRHLQALRPLLAGGRADG